MDYLPVSLKVSHLGMVALGLYVSIEGMVKLSPENTSENAFREVTVNKTRLVASAFALTVFAGVQLALLYNFHNYGGDISNFRYAYFALALVNIILGAIVLAESIELIKIDGMTSTTPTGKLDNPDNVLVAAIVFGALAILFNMVNLYHTRTARNTVMRRSPRRK
tara:strand:- start:85 stop:579 length:495 start_codon:yes stop_codon:yes gene_type:complete